MQLWTDYEGVTIDDAFPLRKLLMPEGRSAFFSTVGTKGESTVMRLIECHFDEEEILARWRCIDALNQPNFLKFERFGQTEIEGRPVVYAVFEKADANLSEVLDRGSLPVKDVAQLAASLVAALDVLHTHGFVHEHVMPLNIFAVEGAVKLRGDCIREAPEGIDGRAAKQRDVRDLVTVLLQALTQQRSLQRTPEPSLPAPFGQIIRNGLDGTWGLENIRSAIEAQFGPIQPVALKPVNGNQATPAPEPKTVASTNGASASAKGIAGASAASVSTATPKAAVSSAPVTSKEAPKNEGKWSPRDATAADQSISRHSIWLGAGVVVIVLFAIWLLSRGRSADQRHAAPSASTASHRTNPGVTANSPALATSPAPSRPATDLRNASQPTLAATHAGWRVITFTYNRRADAEKKVSDLAHSHPDLQPYVFTPTGHAPYLVAIGGVMDKQAALALARRCRSLHLPRDTYAQNYSR